MRKCKPQDTAPQVVDSLRIHQFCNIQRLEGKFSPSAATESCYWPRMLQREILLVMLKTESDT